MRFFSLGEEALKFGLWLSLTFGCVTFSLFSSMIGGLLVGYHLTRRHRSEHIFFSFHLEAIVVGTPVVENTTVELPWSTKKEVANGHWDHITLQSVFIGTNFERDLDRMLDSYGAGVT